MYLSMKLSICIFLAFTACAFSATNPDSQQASLTGALSVNLATEIKVTNSYAETTYTYKLSTSSQEPLEITFNLPSLERTSFLSLSATLHNEVKNSLIVDPHKLKPNTDDSQHTLDLNSPNSIKIGTLVTGETGVVVLSVMEEFESQRDNVWSLTLPSDLFTGPFFVNNEQVSSLESWNINVVNDNHYSLIQDSKLNQVKKGENNISWTIKKGDNSLKSDITLNFKETQFPGWNAILVKHPEYDHDYVLRLDFALDEEVKSKEKIRGSMTLQDVSLQPKPETQKDLPFARDEFIFVIDRSKAIQGENFENLKMMLKKTISKLPMKAFFNIVSFVTKFHFYKFESIQLTEESKQEALEWVSSLQEGSGNSIIDNPVKIATTIPRKDNHLRSMLLFSGKDAANNNEMLNYMEENCRYIRFCHINLGDQGFENLHGDIENVGRCMSASVKDKEEANDKVEHLIEIITYPHLEGITLLVDCFDSDNHSLFLQEEAWNYLSHNQPLRKWFYAHTTKDVHHCTGNFRFTNDTNKQTYQYSFSISVDKQVNNPIWHKVAYTALERILAIKARHAPEGGSKQIMITHIKDMAVRYQVFSEYAATLLTNKGQDEVVVRSTKRNPGTDAIVDEDNLDPTTSNLMNKMFKQEEPEEKIDPAEEEARRIEESKRTDDILMKLVIGIGVVMLILYVVGKVFISKYEKENAVLKEEQEQLEKQFYDKFNKKKRQ